MNVKVILNYLTFKLLVNILCSMFLIYQTYMLSEQYLKFNSVINIKFTRNIIDKLPAITICYNRLISYEKYAERYPQYEEIYKNYIEFVNNFSYIGIKLNRSYDDTISKLNKFHFRKYNELLDKYYLNALYQSTAKESYLNVYDNLSLTFYNDDELNYKTSSFCNNIWGQR